MTTSLSVLKARKALSDYHVASMGDDRKEIELAEAKWNDVQQAWAEANMKIFLYRLVIKPYNTQVIAKAGETNE